MIRRITFIALTDLAVVALISLTFMMPTSVFADGATQIFGVGYFADVGECTDDAGQGADFALRMTGDLEGCHYVFVESATCTPSGVYIETGTETFVSQANGNDSFMTTYRFVAKYQDCANLAGEIIGRCQHPIIAGSGKGIYAGVTGRLDFKDDISAGNFPYRGHLQW